MRPCPSSSERKAAHSSGTGTSTPSSARAARADSFYQFSFSHLAALPTEQASTLWVGYTDKALYIGFRGQDAHPDSLVARFTDEASAEASDNNTPVTESILKDPGRDDWLMYRRTYDAWGYSPLAEINRDNVSSLTLAWSIAMEPGEQETTPVVYAGVMYIAHPGDVIQAVDATNGDLIWEYRRQKVAAGKTRTRNIAIYDDKIFHVTKGEAHLIAVDAQTGQLA